MARKKRKSDAVNSAETRAESLARIAPELDLGKSLTLEDYHAKITVTRTTLNTYNALLAGADVKLEQQERALRDLSERMLEGVSSYFGKNSDEYQKAGGTRKDQSNRKGSKAAKTTKAA